MRQFIITIERIFDEFQVKVLDDDYKEVASMYHVKSERSARETAKTFLDMFPGSVIRRKSGNQLSVYNTSF